MRRHVTSKSKTCMGSRFVNATGISVKVVSLTRGDPSAGACWEVSRGQSKRSSGEASEALQGRKAEQRIGQAAGMPTKARTQVKGRNLTSCERNTGQMASERERSRQGGWTESG
jgi:hypothetical protein